MDDGGKPEGAYHHGDLRPALLRAARDILEEEGLSALTLRGVARRVGVSRAAPYHHFQSKEALLAAVAAEGFRRLSAHLRAAVRELSPYYPELQALGVGYVRFALESPALMRLMFGHQVRDRDAFPDLCAAGAEAFGILLAAATDMLAGVGDTDVPPYRAAVACWSQAHGLAALLMDGQIELEATETADIDSLVLSITAAATGDTSPRRSN